jgi:hypothetical protein
MTMNDMIQQMHDVLCDLHSVTIIKALHEGTFKTSVYKIVQK